MTVKANDTNVRRQYFTVDLPGRPANNGLFSYTITFRLAKVILHSHILILNAFEHKAASA
jgi:hypothetical protein